jgi:hypothetical protein
MPVITTDQAPAAKPIGANLLLTTSYQTLVEAPLYVVPLVGFNTGTTNARGVVEFSSPLIITNIDTTSRSFTVRISRATGFSFVIANAVVVEPNDVMPFPLNGQFLIRDDTVSVSVGDRLELLASANNALVATVSYTEGQAEDDDVT